MKTIPITLDRPRNLRFDINAFSDAEQAMGGSIFSVLADEAWALRFGVLRALLWAGLKHEDPALRQERVGALMQAHLEAGGKTTDFVRWINDGIGASGILKATTGEEKPQDPPPTDPATTG